MLFKGVAGDRNLVSCKIIVISDEPKEKGEEASGKALNREQEIKNYCC